MHGRHGMYGRNGSKVAQKMLAGSHGIYVHIAHTANVYLCFRTCVYTVIYVYV